MTSRTTSAGWRRATAMVAILLGACLLASPAIAGKKKEKPDDGRVGGLAKPSVPLNKPGLMLDTTKVNTVLPKSGAKEAAPGEPPPSPPAESAPPPEAVRPVRPIDAMRFKSLFDK